MAKRKTEPRPQPGVSVVVPFRATPPQRAPLWDHLRSLWAKRYPDYEVVEGNCADDGLWCKGAAVADGIARASRDIVVVADADVWCDGVRAAVDVIAIGGAGWAIPHERVLRLTPSATAEAIESGAWPTVRTATTYMQRPYIGVPGGGIVVLRRETYLSVPIDPRFQGWGQEDEAWAVALHLLAGRPWRGTADLWHMYHGTPQRMSRTIGSSASLALFRRYRGAKSSPRTMAALIAEAAPVAVT